MGNPFADFSGIAAPLPLANVDTDKIIPARFLKTIVRAGLSRGLFSALRFDAEGRERPDFVLNREPWRQSQILIAGDNFGCGSSREHAPWALLDFGIRCIMAPSFADIFYNNCFRNNILPIILNSSDCAELMTSAGSPESSQMSVSLSEQLIRRFGCRDIGFDIEADRKQQLLVGHDEIDFTLLHEAKIMQFEANQGRDGIPSLVTYVASLERT